MHNHEPRIKLTSNKGLVVVLALCLCFSSSTFGQTDHALTTLEQEQYKAWKQGLVSAESSIAQPDISIPQIDGIKSDQPITYTTSGGRAPCTGSYIPPDTTYGTFVGGLGPLPGDDQSEVFAIPFTFTFCNNSFTKVYININGNVTFISALSTFTPTGFPINKPMVAAFWADVDLTGTGTIRYKINPTNMIITWDSVGYYNSQSDKVNTFQIIITDGTDPIIGIGNSLQFRYDDMQWTTGDASGGVNGFGGFPATVGFNSGNATNFEQVGRFDHPGSDHDGPFGSVDGVDWLDGQCIVFTQDNPPVAQCQDVTVVLDATGNGLTSAAVVDNGSADDCGPVTLNLDTTAFNCSDIGVNSVVLIVTDAGGLVDQCHATVTVVDSIPPVARCQDIEVSLDASGQSNLPEDFVDAGSTDNCGGIVFDTDITDFTCEDAVAIAPIMVTMTVSDASSNTNNCTALVTFNISATDSDCDGIGDDCDICPNGDDSVDNSGVNGEPDGVPDCAQNLDIDEYVDEWLCGMNSNIPKLLVCHRPPGNPDSIHTICISVNALQAHLTHGDIIGPCTNCDLALNMQVIAEQLVMEAEYEVYPNPASHELIIRHGSLMQGSTKITIINSQGMIVWSEDLTKGESSNIYRIDLDEYGSISTGLHFVSVTHNDNVDTRQVIVIR